jgi:hypothetical protein
MVHVECTPKSQANPFGAVSEGTLTIQGKRIDGVLVHMIHDSGYFALQLPENIRGGRMDGVTEGTKICATMMTLMLSLSDLDIPRTYDTFYCQPFFDVFEEAVAATGHTMSCLLIDRSAGLILRPKG